MLETQATGDTYYRKEREEKEGGGGRKKTLAWEDLACDISGDSARWLLAKQLRAHPEEQKVGTQSLC